MLAGQDRSNTIGSSLALGCTDNYHGIDGAELYSNSIQTLSASRKTYIALNDVKPYGQVTIVGGGLSGVEVAAELRESRPDLNIRIIDRGPSILSAFPGKLQEYVSSWFIEHEVEMRGHISLVQAGRRRPSRQQQLESDLSDVTVWTAGIQPVELVQRMNLPKDNQGRLIINEYHQLPDYNESSSSATALRCPSRQARKPPKAKASKSPRSCRRSGAAKRRNSARSS